MITTLFAFFFFTLTTAILGLAALSDWRELKIPNHLSIALIGVFLLGCLVPHTLFDGISFVRGLIGGGIVFTALIALYAAGAMGGGDTKLAGALSLLIGVGHLNLFLFVMAFSGGILALYALFARKHPEKLIPPTLATHSWLSQLQQGRGHLPYGLAIAAGGIITLAVKWLGPVFLNFTG